MGGLGIEILRHLMSSAFHFTGFNQTWEIGMVSMMTRRYVGKREGKSLRNMKNC